MDSDNLVNIREAAQQCGRNMETVRRWIWGGKLPAQKLGNQLFIKKKDLAIFCRETATKYRVDLVENEIEDIINKKGREHMRIPIDKEDFPEQAKDIPSKPEAKGIKPSDFAKMARQMREERIIELEERLREHEVAPTPGSRANLIKKMRKLRESIRAQVGNLDSSAAIGKLRKVRLDELNSLR